MLSSIKKTAGSNHKEEPDNHKTATKSNSEKYDGSYRARIDSYHRKEVEAYQRARELKSGLQGSEKLLAKQEDMGAVARKVDKFETELLRLKLH